jgi:transcriptional regulator with XRE-family HTH domain
MIKKDRNHVKGTRLNRALPGQEVPPDMGSARRQSPKLLARKLLQIRQTIGGGLSQEEMVRHLGLTSEIDRTYISRYETGALEPPLKVLLRYAELAGLHLEVLADDGLLMPDEIPCSPKSEGVRRKVSMKSKPKKR